MCAYGGMHQPWMQCFNVMALASYATTITVTMMMT